MQPERPLQSTDLLPVTTAHAPSRHQIQWEGLLSLPGLTLLRGDGCSSDVLLGVWADWPTAGT